MSLSLSLFFYPWSLDAKNTGKITGIVRVLIGLIVRVSLLSCRWCWSRLATSMLLEWTSPRRSDVLSLCDSV